jgi:hypothetical protein
MRTLKIRLITTILFILIINPLSSKAITITSVTKELLNFEILDASIDSNSITLSGWAFINESQHYKNTTDHSIKLEFISLNHSFVVDATLTNLSMTSSFAALGYSYCADGVYGANTCNYYYEYVGFVVNIPLSSFIKGNKYITNIIFNAHLSQKYYKTPLYYPIADTLESMEGDYKFSLQSKLNDTSIKIIESPVYARKTPSKTSLIWNYGANCSLGYLNKLYFKIYSVYTKILDRAISDNQTYYQVSAKTDVCVELRRRIVEGTVLNPVWVSGMFVEYGGAPLQINSILINSNPIISADDFEITAGTHINLLDYAKCYDIEDGDLSNKIIVESSNLQQYAGIYQITYFVEDKYGYYDRKTINIKVKEAYNDPPVINAEDRSVMQYSIFDYFLGISAFDIQDGDLSKFVVVLNTIDSSELVDQELCYKVSDSIGAISVKCIIVSIFSELAMTNKFRYVSKNFLFYNEIIPIMWFGIENDIKIILNNTIAIQTVTLMAQY